MDPVAPAGLLDFTGRVAIVTGGSRGIGEGIARRLAACGARVVIGDIDEARASSTAASIGVGAIALPCDVGDESSVTAFVGRAVAVAGGIDLVVNNAGIFPRSALDGPDAVETWDRIMAINLRGTFLVTRAAAPHFRDVGAVVNIASMNAFHPTYVGMFAYDSSKAGVVGLTRSLAKELAPRGVRVNAIAPGGIRTPGSVGDQSGADLPPSFIERVALGRGGTPADIADVALFLASPMSRYMTGQTLLVDGGYLLS